MSSSGSTPVRASASAMTGPILGGVVDPGGIVAAAVEQHQIAGASAVDRRDQRSEIGAAVGIGVVEGRHFHPQILEDLRVVRPARDTQMDPAGPGALRQRRGQPDGAGAAGGLHSGDAPAHGRVFAEDVGHQCLNETHVAFGAEIALGLLLFEQIGLRTLDGGEHRGGPSPVR
jgi:hypothetical protein